MQFPHNLAQSENHFNIVLHTQKKIVVLTIEEANTRAKLVQIQVGLTPHMEILQKELAYAETMLKKDPNISTLDGLVHLATKTTIQIKSLEVFVQNYDVALNIFMEVNKNFLAKYSVQTL